MQAIRVTEDNVPKILNTATSIVEFDMAAFVNENKELYYIPRLDDAKNDFTGWATYPEPAMSDIFEFDKAKAETDFVEIVRRDR